MSVVNTDAADFISDFSDGAFEKKRSEKRNEAAKYQK